MKTNTRKLKNGGKLDIYLQNTFATFGLGVLRPAILICPGGGFVELSEREAEPIALQYLAHGIQSFVLRYDVLPVKYPIPLLELAESIQFIKLHSEEFLIDSSKIIVSGYSAGGYLAAAMGINWNTKLLKNYFADTALIKPTAMVLCYPVIDAINGFDFEFQNFFGGNTINETHTIMNLTTQVDRNCVPAFICHTFEDECVPVTNSLHLANALALNKIPFAMHIFEKGSHGIALCNDLTKCAGQENNPENAKWLSSSIDFIMNL